MKPVLANKKTLLERISEKLFPNIFRHRKVEQLPLSINWRRIFIVPTKPGLFFAVMAFLMLIASLNFNNNMGLMLTFLLVGLAQVALYRVFFNLKQLEIKQITAKPVFLGQKAVFQVFLRSTENKYDICLKNESAQSCLMELLADKQTPLNSARETRDRGWLELGRIKISTSYPFGLFYAWIWTRMDEKCLVYPQPEKSPPPLPRHAQSSGETTAVMQGEDFHGLKPFQSGDSMRLIAWKRTAQTGELISREFEQLHGKKLLLDFSQVALKDTELKLSRLTAWVLLAYQQQLDYCLKLPQFDSGFGYSSLHHHRCLKALALYGKSEPESQ